MKRLVALVATLGLLVGVVGPASVAASSPTRGLHVSTQTIKTLSTYQGAKSNSGKIARSDPTLLARKDTNPVRVMVKFDADSLASYDGSIDGLAATSPDVTGKALSANPRAVRAYQKHLDTLSKGIRADIARIVPSAKLGQTFTKAYGGVAAIVPANKAADLLKVPGVVAVQSDKLEQPTWISSIQYVGAPKAWQSLGGSRTAGQGVKVGILDTGIWPEHPMLKDPGIPYVGGTYACQFGDGSDPLLGAPFKCNDKLIGAYAFLNTYLSVYGAAPGEFCDNVTGQCSARDADGHGTHTTTTAAGSPVAHAPIFGIDRGPISGVAPGASVIDYRVCLDQGCFQSDSVAAIGQAITDGVNVINYSIGGGADPYADPVELAFLDAYANGISVNASAGNSGPAAGTVEHNAPWVTTVGASTWDGAYLTRLHLHAANGDEFSASGSDIVPGLTTATPVVNGASVPGQSDLCDTPFPAGSLTGKVVVCERGGNGRNEKSFNAAQGGAAGMILYNPTLQNLFTDNFWIPTVMLEGPEPAADLLAFLSSHTGVTARWQTGTKRDARGDVMTVFSSRGPGADFIKPDVTAPGLQILGGNTPVPINVAAGPPGQLYQIIAGTSMSAPHATGVAALVKAAHPSWTPGQIKSALMTSSVQDVLKADGTKADPFDRGAGSIRADRAIRPTITLDVPAAAYYASAADKDGRLDLNVPSIDVDPMPGGVTTTRTVTNVSGQSQSFRVRTTDPKGVDINVSPSRFWLAPGASQTLTVQISAPAVPDGWYFGQITIDPQRHGAISAVLPVAFDRAQGKVTLSHTCDATDLARNVSTTCTVQATNLAPVASTVSLDVSAPRHVTISDVSAPGIPSSGGIHWSGVLAGALAPTVDSIAPAGGTSPAGGYLPLSLFGITPLPGFGDETLTNIGVPAFKWGSETYTQVGIDSNGYVVIGGGTAADNECCNVQTFPDPARPNNVLAPYWTDLDLSAGGAVAAGILNDGVNDFLVVDWEDAPAWGTTNSNSFQIWIQLGSTEGIWYAHGGLDGPSDALSIGAENRDGSSGVNLVGAPVASDYVVKTSPPLPGGTVTITYKATVSRHGTYAIPASMTSDLVRGTAIRTVVLSVH